MSAADATGFARRLLALPEPAIRARVAAERLRALPIKDSAVLLSDIWEQACALDRSCQQVLLDVAANVPLVDALGYEYARALYSACVELGLAPLARLLLPARQEAPANLENNNQMPDMELGRRKALARGRKREVLDRLLWDPDPSVISILLSNPVLIEQDAVSISARRPTHPDSLLHVFRHPRWLPRYSIKLALAANPHLPADATLALLPFLQDKDLRGISRDTALSHHVRVMAGRLGQERKP